MFQAHRYHARHFRDDAVLPPLQLLEMATIEGFEDESGARMDIDRLLATLPPKQAEAIRATRLVGLSTAEAAARQGIGESDVKISVHRGLKALSARIRGLGR